MVNPDTRRRIAGRRMPASPGKRAIAGSSIWMRPAPAASRSRSSRFNAEAIWSARSRRPRRPASRDSRAMVSGPVTIGLTGRGAAAPTAKRYASTRNGFSRPIGPVAAGWR